MGNFGQVQIFREKKMKDSEYVKLLEEMFYNALDEIERLEGENAALKVMGSLAHTLTLSCLKRQRESLFASSN